MHIYMCMHSNKCNIGLVQQWSSYIPTWNSQVQTVQAASSYVKGPCQMDLNISFFSILLREKIKYSYSYRRTSELIVRISLVMDSMIDLQEREVGNADNKRQYTKQSTIF